MTLTIKWTAATLQASFKGIGRSPKRSGQQEQYKELCILAIERVSELESANAILSSETNVLGAACDVMEEELKEGRIGGTLPPQDIYISASPPLSHGQYEEFRAFAIKLARKAAPPTGKH